MNRDLEYTRTYKLFHISVSLLVVLASIFAGIMIAESPSTYTSSTWLAITPFIALGIYMFAKAIFTNGYIHEDHIEEGFIKKQKIYFSEVTQIMVKTDELVLKLDKRPWKVSVSDIYVDFESIKEELLKRLTANKSIKVKHIE